MDTTKKRIIWFDVLRGFFIFLAMWEHWGAALNVWYIEYFKEGFLINNHLGVGGVTNNIYQVHQDMLGKIMPYDLLSVWASYIFTPWVMAVYLTMAAFNLASRTQEDFAKVWTQKLSLYGTLLLFFIIENFVLAQSLGEALTLYPLMTWMIILSLLTVLYRFTGLGGIGALFILSMTQWFLPIPEMNIEHYIKTHIHPAMSLDAAPHYFTASASLGFMLGYCYYHKPAFKSIATWLKIALLGVGMFTIGFLNSDAYYLEQGAYFKTEHLKASTFFGMVEILGIQLVVLSLALIAHFKQIQPSKWLSGFTWVGVNSLGIFALHRMFFFYLWMPTITWITAIIGTPVPNGIFFIWPTIVVYLGFFYFIMKTKILRIVMRD
jgi:hypothetical protein